MRALLALALCAAAACGRSREDGPLRLGYFPNVTHAQALVGLDEGVFAAALGGRIESRMFTSGPSAMESLVAGDLDAAYVGPGPAANAFLRTEGRALRIVAGASSGGAVLVVRDARGAWDLAGRRVATPGLGNTQDVALRTWLRGQGLSDRGGPRGVEVTPLPGPDLLQLFGRGDLAGAWVAEPWGARLVAQAGGRILVDERELWPGGEFPTAVLAVSTRALARRRKEVIALVRAHAELTRRWQEDEAAFADRANEAYARRTSRRLAPGIVRDAFSRVTPTLDPMPALLAEMARRAQALGLAPGGDVSGMVDASLLGEVARR